MSFVARHTFSRRGFCICCAVAAGFVRTGAWLSPSQAYAEAQNIVDLIRDDAARAPIRVHKLRGNVSILEGSGGNIAVLTGALARYSSMPVSPRHASASWKPPTASAEIPSHT